MEYKEFLPVIAFVIVLIIKNLLDLRIMPLFVQYFWWFSARNFLRIKTETIAGQWEQHWESGGSTTFVESTGRHGHPIIKQWAHYCYTETVANQKVYVVFGKIVGEFFIGDWYDKDDLRGYFGTFQLHIKDSKTMEGKWMGHSKTEMTIRCDDWVWKKL
ncbi:MAG: hypothetical protein PHW18_07230 [Sulfuricurvum sp.]|uniref:hypothetical protein n=1 Tax=Sulfuricurvum sp. TaxID=2025608 RepID=UPI0026209C4B|nr:hypothetical protein [Sulfuricurvum sp.]MDD2829347.1 hypothetical protein [Sulfuricurvum sp.]MDD4949161.1 hypothetical protein [Sulfuricurvum sp.]